MNAILHFNRLSWRRHIRRWPWYFQEHIYLVITLVSIAGIGILYLPSLTAYFISDDFQYVSYLYYNVTDLLNWNKLDFWFIGGMDGYLYFRPLGHAIILLDYVSWGVNPWGYHLTNTFLHILASLEIFLLSGLVFKNRPTATVTAVLFAVLPVHAGAVSWIAARYDVLSGLYYFASFIFFILYVQKSRLRFYLISLAAFAFALSSKETAFTLPAALLCYDLLFNWRGFRGLGHLVKRHSLFWLVLAIRIMYFGHGYRGFQLIPEGWAYWADLNIFSLVDPLLTNPVGELRWLLIACAGLLLMFYRPWQRLAFGLMWIPITASATLASGPSDRSFYIPSFGLCLILAAIFALLQSQQFKPVKVLGYVTFFLIVAGYAAALFSRNQGYHRAGEIARAIPAQVLAMHPAFPDNARVVFTGVPDYTPEGILVYLSGFPGLLKTAYASQKFQVYKFNKFPIWLDMLDRTYFFVVDHRKVNERLDLVRALEARKGCANSQFPGIEWDFSRDLQGWEAWDQLAEFQIRGGELTMQSLGHNPIIGGPLMAIPSIAIADVDITMRVRGDSSRLNGTVYWRATDQNDFSPDLKVIFPVEADGEQHTYHVDIAKDGKLLIGDQILQLRLDPSDAPADIALKSIQIRVHCSSLQGDRCSCEQ